MTKRVSRKPAKVIALGEGEIDLAHYARHNLGRVVQVCGEQCPIHEEGYCNTRPHWPIFPKEEQLHHCIFGHGFKVRQPKAARRTKKH